MPMALLDAIRPTTMKRKAEDEVRVNDATTRKRHRQDGDSPKKVKKVKSESAEKKEKKRIKEQRRKEKEEKKAARKERKEKKRKLKEEKAAKKRRKEEEEKKQPKTPTPEVSSTTPVDSPASPTPSATITAASPPPTSSSSTPSHRSESPKKGLLKKKSTRHSKSVQFAADVKTEDGDSIKQIYLALDPFGKIKERTRGSVENDNSPPTEPVPASPEKPTESVKPPAASPEKPSTPSESPAAKKAGPKHGGSNSNNSTQPYLDYLMEFQHNRAGWKFNKAKQVWILKHIFDTELIPTSHDKALSTYINGLQGIGARDRLLDEAKKLLNDEEQKEKLPRAKIVVSALGRKDLVADSDSESSDSEDGTVKTNGVKINGAPVPPTKTAEESSDSEESDSSNSSDSDSD